MATDKIDRTLIKQELDNSVIEAKRDETLRWEAEKYHRMTDSLNTTERRNRILSMIRNGATGEQVCEILARGDPQRGIPPYHTTPGQISALVKKYLDRVHTEDALTIEQLRVLENERLDAMWAQMAAAIKNPDGTPNLKVIDRMTRLSERRAKMNGLDAAQKHEHFIGNGLEALGLEAEHVLRSREAFQTSYIEQGVKDVHIEGEAQEIEELGA